MERVSGVWYAQELAVEVAFVEAFTNPLDITEPHQRVALAAPATLTPALHEAIETMDTTHRSLHLASEDVTMDLFSFERGHRMGFEVFDKRHAPLRGTPSVTVQKRGIVSINGPAHKLIDGARVVELLFDRDRQVMAIRPAEPSPRAYELREPSRTGQTILSATAFMDAFQVDTTISRRYEPFVEDGMLCINFAGESTEIRGNRSRQGEGANDA